MNKTFPYLCAAAVLALSSCISATPPQYLRGDRATTQQIDINRSDCKLVLGRARGESVGLTILFLPIIAPNEAEAVDAMYEYARTHGAVPEGHSRVFANTSLHYMYNWRILYARPSIRASGDLVEYVGPAPRN